MTEKELEEFTEIPVPGNVNVPTKLDPFMKVLLEKKGLNKSVSVDEEMEKLHNRLYQMAGPLGKAWSSIQRYVQRDSEDGPDPEETLQSLNSVMVLLGQTINKVTYERRVAVLATLNDVKKAKR